MESNRQRLKITQANWQRKRQNKIEFQPYNALINAGKDRSVTQQVQHLRINALKKPGGGTLKGGKESHDFCAHPDSICCTFKQNKCILWKNDVKLMYMGLKMRELPP